MKASNIPRQKYMGVSEFLMAVLAWLCVYHDNELCLLPG